MELELSDLLIMGHPCFCVINKCLIFIWESFFQTWISIELWVDFDKDDEIDGENDEDNNEDVFGKECGQQNPNL